MPYQLSLEQRDQIMGQLTEEQRHFIHHVLVRGRRTMFARHLAKVKCQFIPEDAELEEIESHINEWDYIGFTDSGEVSPHTKCECGRSLRYQHQVLHLPTNKMRYFGIDHLQLHTGIDAKTINDIMKGFDVLDSEMNEMLHKYQSGWKLNQHMYQPFPLDFEVPHDVQEHLNAELPLLDRQLAKLRNKLRDLEKVNRQKPPVAAAAETHSISEDVPAKETQAAFMVLDDNQGFFVFEEVDVDVKQAPVPIESSSDLFHLPSSAKRIIDDAIPLGRISCLAVSEFLVKQKLVSSKRMATGKPDIYIAVAAYLDKLTANGRCVLVETSAEDRVYTAQ